MGGGETPDVAAEPPARGPVLLVEDNDRNRKLVRELLELRAYTTIETDTGEQAVELAARHHPLLIVLDVALPGIDGVSTLERLRADAATADIPVVAVTAAAMPGDRERLLGAGFDGYLSKPIDVRTFVDALEGVLQRSG